MYERVLALDVGDVRIGLALSDALGLTAQPFDVYRRQGDEQDVVFLLNIAKEKGAKTLLFGLPRNMDGSEGFQAEKVRAFAALFEGFDVEIEFIDERLTTVSVEKMLISGDASRAKRKQVVDKLAAAVFLQNYLDGGRA